MGILDRLKEILNRTSVESLKDFELELYRIKQKTNSKLIALIGTGGRLKGLPLIYTFDDDKILNKIAAKLCEVKSFALDISDEKKLNEIILNYENNILIFNPFMKDIGFFAIIQSDTDIISIRTWMEKKLPTIKALIEPSILSSPSSV
ncbi:MAG TPA: hypothetical protein VGB37_14420 [Candidatus Lokiarchaeia archaeon]